jgi:hypothetical protein
MSSRLDEFNLMMIEQPLAGTDAGGVRRITRQLRTPVCLDEASKTWPLWSALSPSTAFVLPISRSSALADSETLYASSIFASTQTGRLDR